MTVALLEFTVTGEGEVPQALAEHCGTLITVGLCLILFLVGVDMGRQGNVWRDIKAAGFKVEGIAKDWMRNPDGHFVDAYLMAHCRTAK